LIAPQSEASFDITVKIVVPTAGNFESMASVDWCMGFHEEQDQCQSKLHFTGVLPEKQAAQQKHHRARWHEW
jgi:hypothetical protein